MKRMILGIASVLYETWQLYNACNDFIIIKSEPLTALIPDPDAWFFAITFWGWSARKKRPKKHDNTYN